MSTERMIGMTERRGLIVFKLIALSLNFKETREHRQKKEGTDNV